MWGQGKEYSFDERGISRQVLENYLDRSITMVYLLMPDKPEGRRVYSYHADDMRMVKDIGAKVYRSFHLPVGRRKLVEQT